MGNQHREGNDPKLERPEDEQERGEGLFPAGDEEKAEELKEKAYGGEDEGPDVPLPG